MGYALLKRIRKKSYIRKEHGANSEGRLVADPLVLATSSGRVTVRARSQWLALGKTALSQREMQGAVETRHVDARLLFSVTVLCTPSPECLGKHPERTTADCSSR